MRVGFTYNIKKEIEHELMVSNVQSNEKFIDNNLVENYSHRISDVYAEWDDEETISAIENSIKKDGHDVIRIEAGNNVFEKLRSARPDIVFNMAEGYGGASRESHIPSLL